MPISRFLRFGLAAAAVFLVSTTALAEGKVAVVNTQRAISESEEGLRAQATLKKLFENRQKELSEKQEQLQKEREELEKQKGSLPPAQLQARFEKWQQAMMQLQQTFVEYNKEIQKKESEMTAPIMRHTMEVISRLARQDGYDLVVDTQAVPYFRGDLDVTDKVISLVNESEPAAPAKGGAAKPAPAKPAAAPAKPAAAPAKK